MLRIGHEDETASILKTLTLTCTQPKDIVIAFLNVILNYTFE